MRRIPLILNTGKTVGEIQDDIAIFPVTSRNYLAIGKGYSVDERVFRVLEVAGCTIIDFWNKKTGKHQKVSVQKFRERCKRFDFGFGGKLVAPMSCYEQDN